MKGPVKFRECVVCREPFRKRRTVITCSGKCARLNRNAVIRARRVSKRKPALANCVICSGVFDKKSNQSKCCGDSCRSEKNNRYNREQYRKKTATAAGREKLRVQRRGYVKPGYEKKRYHKRKLTEKYLESRRRQQAKWMAKLTALRELGLL